MAPDFFHFDLRELRMRRDDLLLLATNGLWKPSALDLPPLAASVEHRPLELVREWLTAARRNGSLDDQTAIAVLVE
jgi:serine/threonine protein phosphatase PrpC